MAKEIIMIIDEFGGVTGETKGFKGSSCVADIENLMPRGGYKFKVVKKDEYYQSNDAKDKHVRRRT